MSVSSGTEDSLVILINDFTDDTQNKLDLYVDEYQCKENLDDLVKFIEDNHLQEDGQLLLLRLCQSMLNYWNLRDTTVPKEINGKSCKKELAVNLFATYWNLEEDNDFAAKLIDMVQPLLASQVDSENLNQKTNLCLILAVLSQKFSDALLDNDQNLDHVISFLAKVIRYSSNTSLLLYALMSVEKLGSSSRLNREKLINPQAKYRLDRVLEQFADKQLIDSMKSPIVDYRLQQVSQYARWLLVNLFGPLSSPFSTDGAIEAPKPVTLNPLDKTSNLNLSADNLSVRSVPNVPQYNNQNRELTLELFINLNTNQTYQAVGFQSIRATEPADSSSSGDGIFFYEAMLLTDGVMQIGWATKECFIADGSADGIGDDRHSIGFDANRQAIWHLNDSGNEYPIECHQWKAGDVLGCLVDVKKRNFIFYLNGTEFDCYKLGMTVNFSNLAYYPAASLTSYTAEQVYFNFGQERFSFPPVGVKYRDFYGNRFNPTQEG